MTLMTLKVIQWQLLRPFYKTSSKIVLKGGPGAGISVWLPKGSALKATTVMFSTEVYSTFTVISSRTLLSDHAFHKLTNVFFNETFFKSYSDLGFVKMKDYNGLIRLKIIF
jgi:hypothetical protein